MFVTEKSVYVGQEAGRYHIRRCQHWLVKPKFSYADFATLSVADFVMDTNHESLRHKSCRQLSWFVFVICHRLCCRLSLCIVTEHNPLLRHKRLCRGLITDFVANISTCWDGLCSQLFWFLPATFTKTSWFHDLSPFLSATFIICVHDSPQGSFSESRCNWIWALCSSICLYCNELWFLPIIWIQLFAVANVNLQQYRKICTDDSFKHITHTHDIEHYLEYTISR